VKKGFSFAFADEPQARTLVRLAAEAGFDSVEPTFMEKGFPCFAQHREDSAKLKKLCDEHGLRIASMRGGPMFWPRFASPDPAKAEEILRVARAAMESLQIMGGEVLLAVPGQWEPGMNYRQALEQVRTNARKLAPIANELGITVGLENVQNRLFLSPAEWCSLIDDVGQARIRMYFDVGNVLWLRLGLPEDWLRQIGGERICRVHFKDATELGKIVPLLEGQVNWSAVRAALREIGYDGWIHGELDLYPVLPGRLLEKTARDIDAIWALPPVSDQK
jgi:L-ribulose-5-phosphate 3-epimerase